MQPPTKLDAGKCSIPDDDENKNLDTRYQPAYYSASLMYASSVTSINSVVVEFSSDFASIIKAARGSAVALVAAVPPAFQLRASDKHKYLKLVERHNMDLVPHHQSDQLSSPQEIPDTNDTTTLHRMHWSSWQ